MPKQTTDTKIAVMSNDIKYIKGELADIKASINDVVQNMESAHKDLVPRSEFAPIQKIVYGFVTIVLVTVVGAVLGLVILKP